MVYVLKIVRTELISRYHDNPLARHFGIKKTRELVAQKYYWLTLKANVKSYVKGYHICLALKVVKHKLYSDLQSLPIPTYQWKDLSMDFVTSLPISSNWKSETYNLILVIIDRLTKMVHYELVKVNINAPGLAEVIIDVVVRHYSLLNSIVNDRSSVFTSKF